MFKPNISKMKKLIFCVLAIAGMLTASCTADNVAETPIHDEQFDGPGGGSGGITPPPPPPKPKVTN